MDIENKSWENLCAMDDAADAKLFDINELPSVAFYCHEEIIKFYLKLIQK